MARIHPDENVPVILTRLLAELDHDMSRTDDPYRDATPPKHTPDHRQLWYAVNEGAIIVTGNAWDFSMLHDAWLLWGVPRSHPGIIGFQAISASEVAALVGAIDALVRNPNAVVAAQADRYPGEPIPSTNGDGTLVNQLYYRRRDGRWTDTPPKPRR